MLSRGIKRAIPLWYVLRMEISNTAIRACEKYDCEKGTEKGRDIYHGINLGISRWKENKGTLETVWVHFFITLGIVKWRYTNKIKPQDCTFRHGQTLFIPRFFCHFYIGSISITVFGQANTHVLAHTRVVSFKRGIKIAQGMDLFPYEREWQIHLGAMYILRTPFGWVGGLPTIVLSCTGWAGGFK